MAKGFGSTTDSVQNLFRIRQAFTHVISMFISKKRTILSKLETGPGPHLGILPEPVYWYFPARTVLYYSLFDVRTLPLRWSFLTEVVKLVRNVPY